jgi:hypothetical protein
LFNSISIILITGLLCVSAAYGQKSAAPKFGKPDPDWLKATVCPIDSNAHAYYIFDRGDSYIDISSSGRFQLIFERHFAIKILDKDGLDWANINIFLMRSGDAEEKLTSFNAYTYNGSGKDMEKLKLDRKDVLREQTSDNLTTMKIAMPGVKEGSVIEAEYVITSDFVYNLQPWAFQSTIPELYTEYKVSIPEYFYYNQVQQGYLSINTRQEKSSGSFHLSVGSVQYNSTVYHYTATNVPAFIAEPFLRTPNNYITKVKYELNWFQLPMESRQNYTTSWDDIEKKLLENDHFGRAIGGGYLKDAAKELKQGGAQGEELILACLKHIREKIKWNNAPSLFAYNTTKAYKDGQGNSADINLNLVGLLREAGFNSAPLAMSLQTHGILPLTSPSMSAFNYVVAIVKEGDNFFLLDATDPNSTINLLPVRCINDKGRVIGTTMTEKWVSLTETKPFTDFAGYNLTLDANLLMKGTVQRRLGGYGALNYLTLHSEADKAKEIEEKILNAKITDFKMDNQLEKDGNLIVEFALEKEKAGEQAGDMLYFNLPDLFWGDSPFKLEKRDYPVEFNFPYKITKTYTFTVPEGYQISELPKPCSIKLPNNDASFLYSIQSMEHQIVATSVINIRKTLFLPDEYAGLKEFFQQLTSKQKEVFVLKKI